MRKVYAVPYHTPETRSKAEAYLRAWEAYYARKLTGLEAVKAYNETLAMIGPPGDTRMIAFFYDEQQSEQFKAGLTQGALQ